MIRNVLKVGAMAVLVTALGACEKELTVTNPNSPETRRVLAVPADAEALLAGYYKRWHSGLYQNLGTLQGMLNMLSFQNYSSLANNCQNARTQFTGVANSNSPGNVCAGEQSSQYYVMGEVNRVAASVLKSLNDTLGTVKFTLGSSAQNQRARAFAEFLNGVSLGYLAMFYDSASVVTPVMTSTEFAPYIDYKSMMDSAQAALQRSLDAANDATVTGINGFPLPSTWIPSPTSWTVANFNQLVRSYRARLTINNARTTAERAAPCFFIQATGRTCVAANWNTVLADAAAGFTVDNLNTMSTTSGPFNGWVDQYESFGTWSQIPGFMIGMAEGTGANYDAWVKTDIAARSVPFFMVTPDKRFPQGATRALQQADFAISSCQGAALVCKRYFVNRNAGNDQNVGAGWGFSNYDFVRFHSWRTSGATGSARNGDLVIFTKSELNLIQAEAEIRRPGGSAANAATLVNISRLVAGLAAIPAAGCAADGIPRVPNGAGPTATLACGTLLEAMKYEKRIETAFTHFGAWFLDSRGWGDLAKDTPLYWATPYQDVLARGKAVSTLYGTGPTTNPSNAVGSSQAALSTYGY